MGRQLVCYICWRTITEEINRVFCPGCDAAYHRKHIQAWVWQNKSCPSCRNDFHSEMIKILNFQNPYWKYAKPHQKRTLQPLLASKTDFQRTDPSSYPRIDLGEIIGGIGAILIPVLFFLFFI